ncbi:uncharacterized protein CC84DRAFT_1102263 [Paraphaeosphaeria sporulosa]|uniref:NAD(P)-binding domain-containing protein n=1 Tax=Paraphaeosphaeria sporulosa TaxID=1460663 RepID=A0A177BZ23_9PLEO|nr:uncharacterized protein CC84DRAFT_1102263 [Paraphaeosphaeria sporulosa]OAG00623.1 hypothetical protein CC84DRAFT_1102263 [Paraphaeosphaeria sporulosa]
MLANDAVSRVSILSRRPVKMAEGHEAKAKVIIHKDFKTYDQALLDELKDAQGCVWALGVSQNDVDKAQYFEITHEYPLAAANAFSKLHPESPFTFVFVSAEGATHNPGMFSAVYERVKGQVEKAMFEFYKATPNFKLYTVRPAGVDWRSHPEIQPFMPSQPFWKRALIPVIDTVYKPMITPTRPMGRIMTELAMSKGKPLEGEDIQMEGTLVSNVAFRRLAGL